MELRHILLMAALITAIIFVIPTVYSIFSGQHTFNDPGKSYCLKCHSDIRTELDGSSNHLTFTCENCHVMNMNTNRIHENVTSPRCLDCHDVTQRMVTDSRNNTYISPLAKMFGEENVTGSDSHDFLI
ncbi:MAG TPA: hypothetical protein VIO11_10720, partial [Candidatus Methanoperedens sp.]